MRKSLKASASTFLFLCAILLQQAHASERSTPQQGRSATGKDATALLPLHPAPPHIMRSSAHSISSRFHTASAS